MDIGMEYSEFRRQIRKAGLSNQEFACLLKLNPKSISNYKKKDVPSHLAVIAVLMAEMAELKFDFRAVLKQVDIGPKKPRGGAGALFFRGRTIKKKRGLGETRENSGVDSDVQR